MTLKKHEALKVQIAFDLEALGLTFAQEQLLALMLGQYYYAGAEDMHKALSPSVTEMTAIAKNIKNLLGIA
jgi:hypothetical protein